MEREGRRKREAEGKGGKRGWGETEKKGDWGRQRVEGRKRGVEREEWGGDGEEERGQNGGGVGGRGLWRERGEKKGRGRRKRVREGLG